MTPRLLILTLLLLTTPAYAGMGPGPITLKLDTLVTYRIEALSFFLAITLLSALLIQWLWNALAKDFPRLPNLTYFRAFALTLLWALFLSLILNMTTAARELMTPGAWERTPSGLQYQLTDPLKQKDTDRQKRLQALSDALIAYAKSHNNQFPSHLGQLPISEKQARIADDLDIQYIYFPGRSYPQSKPLVLLYEPDIYNDDRFCILTDGQILKLNLGGMAQRLAEDTRYAHRPSTQPEAAP